MKTYDVTATREGDWWIVTVPDLPGVFTQARRLEQVAPLATDAIALWLNKRVGSVSVHVHPVIPNAQSLVDAARAARGAAAESATVAATTTSAAVVRLAKVGLPLRDIGALLEISHQRAGQILEAAGKR